MGFLFWGGTKDVPCPGIQVEGDRTKPCCGGLQIEVRTDPPRERMRQVITLVHGTFAKHAPWMRDDSELCKELQSLDGTAFRRFCWSGGNSHSARLQAGDDLAWYLSEVRKQFPEDVKHFVIAHSHGGNVALYAMESKSPDGRRLGEDIAGVITLATPFITLRKRQLPKFVIPSALFTIAFVSVVGLIAVLRPPTQEVDNNLSWATVGFLTTLFLIWVTGTLVSAKLYRRPNFSLGILWQLFRNRHEPEQTQLDAQLLALQPQSLDADKLLVMRPLGDEANMSLVISQSLSWAQNKILSFLQRFQDGFLGRKSDAGISACDNSSLLTKLRSAPGGCFFSMLKLGSILALLIWVSIKTHSDSVEKHAIGFVVTTAAERFDFWAQLLLLIPMVFFAGLLAFFVIFGLLSLYALIGLLLAAAPFGFDAMFWNHFTSTTAEPAPVGRPTHIFHAAAKDGSVDSGLAHSGIYTNPVAIHQIVDWIRSRSMK